MRRLRLAKRQKKVRGLLLRLDCKLINPILLKTPNTLTIKTIEDARNGIGISKPIKNISDFINAIK